MANVDEGTEQQQRRPIYVFKYVSCLDAGCDQLDVLREKATLGESQTLRRQGHLKEQSHPLLRNANLLKKANSLLLYAPFFSLLFFFYFFFFIFFLLYFHFCLTFLHFELLSLVFFSHFIIMTSTTGGPLAAADRHGLNHMVRPGVSSHMTKLAMLNRNVRWR